MKDYKRQTDFVVANNNTNFIDYTKFNQKGKSVICNFLPKNFLSIFVGLTFVISLLCSQTLVMAEESPSESPSALSGFDAVAWQTDYEAAKQKAKEQSKNLLIYFFAEVDSPTLLNATEERYVKTGNNNSVRQVAYVMPELQKPLPIAAACREFEKRSFSETVMITELNRYILLKLPIDAKTTSGSGAESKVLDLPMFQEMGHLPGLAVIDYEHKTEPYYEGIVGILPFIRAKPPTPEQVQAFLTLPPGTLTQRTLIYALRIHPEKPLSTMGTFHPYVTKEASEHSAYQAKTGVLGHQNFGARSARVSQEIGEGSASEICAQSWSDESLYEAAIGCVRAWRSSSGHWNMARKKHTYFGYDMVLGNNGVWYATGLFVD